MSVFLGHGCTDAILVSGITRTESPIMEPLLRKHERDGARLYYQIGRAFALMGPRNWPLWSPISRRQPITTRKLRMYL